MKYVEANGVRFAYEEEGDPKGLLALIPALGAEKAIVVGHDWGASAAYSAASLGPEKVSLLVTVAIPHPSSIRPTPTLAWHGRHFFAFQLPGAAARTRKDDFAHLDELVQRWSPKWNVPKGESDAVKRAFREPGSLEAALGYYWAMRPRPPESLRHRIRVPAVAFAGLDDIVPPELYDRAASWFTAGYRVIRMPGGHFMHREHPQRFIDELLAVLRNPSSVQ